MSKLLGLGMGLVLAFSVPTSAHKCEVGDAATLKVIGDAFQVDAQSSTPVSKPLIPDKYFATCFGESEGTNRFLSCGFTNSQTAASDQVRVPYVTVPAATPLVYFQAPRVEGPESYFIRCKADSATPGEVVLAQKYCSCDLSSQVLEEYDLNINIDCNGEVRKIKLAHYEDSFQCINNLDATQSCKPSSGERVNVCSCKPKSVVLETYNLVRTQIACGKPDVTQVIAQGLDEIACNRAMHSNPGCR